MPVAEFKMLLIGTPINQMRLQTIDTPCNRKQRFIKIKRVLIVNLWNLMGI